MGWMAGVRFLVDTRGFSLLHTLQIGFGAHLAYYLNGTGGFLHGSKESGGVKLTTHIHLMQRQDWWS
jgi:hypothetical protein